MNDIRFQKVEAKLDKHEKLHETYESRFQKQELVNDSTIENFKAITNVVAAIQDSVKAHEKNTAAAVNLTEKIENLAEALGILGKFAKWVLAVAGMCTLIIGAVKGWYK